MKHTKLFSTLFTAAAGVAIVVGSIAIAETPKESKPAAGQAAGQPAGQPEIKLPPGWTEEDAKACMLAATPGKQHEWLAREAGEWQGRNTLWMGPGTDPIKTQSSSTVTPILDGRFTKCEMKGEMPGMGPYNGIAIYGFDNVTQKFVATWIDNHSTSIMTGVGELSPDGKVLTWNFTYSCPITKKPAKIREVETTTGPNTKTIEMFGADPKSGKEYKMMVLELTKKTGEERAGK